MRFSANLRATEHPLKDEKSATVDIGCGAYFSHNRSNSHFGHYVFASSCYPSNADLLSHIGGVYSYDEVGVSWAVRQNRFYGLAPL